MRSKRFVTATAAEFAIVMAGGRTSKLDEPKGRFPVTPDEVVLGVVRSQKTIEVRKLLEGVIDFTGDYLSSEGVRTVSELMLAKGSARLDHIDIFSPLCSLTISMAMFQWSLIFAEFPSHYHQGKNLGIRHGMQLVRVDGKQRVRQGVFMEVMDDMAGMAEFDVATIRSVAHD